MKQVQSSRETTPGHHPSEVGGATPVRIALLGSTGSIGTQTLDVVSRLGGKFKIVCMAAGSDRDALLKQAAELPEPPMLLALGDEKAAASVSDDGPPVLSGEAGMIELATHPEVDLVVVATTGHAGFAPTLAALNAGKELALANKEALVMAGEIVTEAARRNNRRIRPIDSEHSAIWQCLVGEPEDPDLEHSRGASGCWSVIEKLVLTASGGPFRSWSAQDTAEATREQALKHPTWNMGAKVTIDSASLMNKGLEVIEAHWLFGVPFDDIEVVIHQESIIHSMVRFIDGSAKAQLGIPDMRVPIQYALTYPSRSRNPAFPRADWAQLGTLHFENVDAERFRCLGLAFEAGRLGATYPTVLAAADEVAVGRFLGGEIRFGDIPGIIESVLNKHGSVAVPRPDIEAIVWADRWARQVAAEPL
ncbi:MAG TPA: 1-deoxy-D-xylulose-5-phosphate reductoisomerase [Chloroflexia bacterium]|nr:1-deoxy-D-xylulose-5-phosphate reductoisomerase [Chloroflexia bacterium]